MAARVKYDEVAAGRVDAVAQAWSEPLSLQRVISVNAHAEVLRCGLGDGVDVCLKLLHSCEEHLAYLERVLERMWGEGICGTAANGSASAEHASSRAADSSPMPPVLRAGRVSLPTGETALALVTPWAEGVSLLDAMRQAARLQNASPEAEGPLLRDGLDILAELARVLRDLGGLMAGEAVIHGDLKPSNAVIRLREDDPACRGGASRFHVTLIDYDTVFVEGMAPSPLCCGSFGHAAPELIASVAGAARGWRLQPIDSAADVFSFGVIAHELLTGHLPYANPPHPDAPAAKWMDFYRMMGCQPAPDPSLPADVRQLVTACLAADPALRPSASELAERACTLAATHADDPSRCNLADAGMRASIPTASLLWDDASSTCFSGEDVIPLGEA